MEHGYLGSLYRPLNKESITSIHDAALTIISDTGIVYENLLESLAQEMSDLGLLVDKEKKCIRFPISIVEKALSRVPGKVVLYSRDGRRDLHLEGHRVHMGTGGAALNILDLETGEVRQSTLKDLYQLARLADRLENIDFFVRPCIPNDIPPEDYDCNVYYVCLKGTTKHVMAGVNDVAGFKTALDLASMLTKKGESLRERPFISAITSFMISPLKLCSESTAIMREAVMNGIPVALSAGPMAGSTAPITMAGAITLAHAEQLAGITICQLINPGSPILYGGIPSRTDLRTMSFLTGAVECGMMNAAIHQMAHHIDVPNYNSAGLTDSKLPDAQAGWEKAMTLLSAAMAGSNYIHHAVGLLESTMTVAHEQFVMDDEIVGMTRRVLRGIEVDPERLATEIIESVGPGGNFMTDTHTVKYMRSEYFYGNGVSDSQSRDRWCQQGSMDAWQRAKLVAKRLLADPEKTCISEKVDQAIRERFNILI